MGQSHGGTLGGTGGKVDNLWQAAVCHLIVRVILHSRSQKLMRNFIINKTKSST